jgi:hypothetical protein
MRLHSLQTGVADRQAGCFLDASGSALPTGRRRSSRRASSSPPPGVVGFSAESCQHALGYFQLIELNPEPSAFGIEPREPFGNPLLLLSNLVHRSHLLYPFSSLDTEDDVMAPVFSMEKCVCCFDDYHSEPLSMSAGIADKLAPIFLNMKMTPFYDEPDRDAAIDTLRHARGIDADFLDTSDAYGQGRNEELIAHAVKGHCDEYVIASKFGNLRAPDGSPISDGRPEYVKACCERSLKRFETDASTSITSIVSTRPCRSRTPSE